MSVLSDPPKNTRKFIKILGSRQEGFLCLPEEFQKECLRPMPRNVTLSTTDGRLWIVGLLCYRGIGYLAAGWRAFRNFYELKKGDIIIAKFDRESHFHITIFLKNSMEKLIEGDDIHHGPDIVHNRSQRRRHSEMLAGRFDGDNVSEDEEEERLEAVLSAVSPRTFDRNKELAYFLNPDEFVEMNTVERNALYGEHVPFCFVVMFSWSLAPTFEMKLPMDFSRSELSPGVKTIQLKRKGHGIWKVICRMDGNRAKIIEGWEEFATDNNLQIYDQCTIERNIALGDTWNVTIFKNM